MRKKLLALSVLLLLLAVLSACGKTYEVTFDLNGGTLVSGETTQEVKEGEAAVAPEVEMENHTLSWDSDFSEVTGDMTVTAQWEQTAFTVTFDLNGGTLVSGETTQTVEKGQAAKAPEVEMERHALTWDKDFSNVTEDMTVTAQWERAPMDPTELAAYVQERTVTINVTTITDYETAGSGFFIDDQGTIVTNYHVIDLGAKMSVEAPDGTKYDVAQVIDFSPVYDLALLKIDLTGNPYLTFSEEEAVTGQQVYAVGSALGTLTGSFTGGTVSSASRTIGLIDCLQMDTPISNGNSGGPLVNIYGDVVGVNTFSYEDGENLNLAIKPEVLDNLARDKNYTVDQFREWYTTESSRSYSPYDGEAYYYSLVNTYQTVTGAECLFSYDEEGNASEGYYDCSVYYAYPYNTEQYDQYTAYLQSLGFVYQDSENFTDGVSYYYLDEKDGVVMDLFITSDNSNLLIFPRG